jgi:hypothetical protein
MLHLGGILCGMGAWMDGGRDNLLWSMIDN